MKGEKITKVLEIRTAEGSLLATVRVKITEDDQKAEEPQSRKQDEAKSEEKKAWTNNGEALMTDAQKRYLFRLLADQGIENDAAHENLKKRFQVNNLKDVTKVGASKEIELLLAGQKGGESYAS